METKLDYAKLWTTMLRLGLKQRFSDIRKQFFMTLATDGYREYQGAEAIEDIVGKSYVFGIAPELKINLYPALKGDRFKHHTYSTEDGMMHIEYFANLDNGINEDFVKSVKAQFPNIDADMDCDGYCESKSVQVTTEVADYSEINEETGEPGKMEVLVNETNHLIIVFEKSDSINPDTYPGVIKHELTHACIYEMRQRLKDKWYDSHVKTPANWTDEDIENWVKDVENLRLVLDSDDEDAHIFREFVSEFLMYESDGQTKEKNPVREVSTVKSGAKGAAPVKPKVTYRTLTPISRFEETLDYREGPYNLQYQLIINELIDCYKEYDRFLDSIRMG